METNTYFLPKEIHLYSYVKEKSIVFYLAQDHQDLNYNPFYSSKCYGYITGVIEDAHSTITWVGTHQDYMGLGIASFLILVYADYLQGLGHQTIELDDDSDFTRTPQSIYLKLGFKYQVEGPEENKPEMIGKVADIMSHWNRFKQTYTSRGFFHL